MEGLRLALYAWRGIEKRQESRDSCRFLFRLTQLPAFVGATHESPLQKIPLNCVTSTVFITMMGTILRRMGYIRWNDLSGETAWTTRT